MLKILIVDDIHSWRLNNAKLSKDFFADRAQVFCASMCNSGLYLKISQTLKIWRMIKLGIIINSRVDSAHQICTNIYQMKESFYTLQK